MHVVLLNGHTGGERGAGAAEEGVEAGYLEARAWERLGVRVFHGRAGGQQGVCTGEERKVPKGSRKCVVVLLQTITVQGVGAR